MNAVLVLRDSSLSLSVVYGLRFAVVRPK